MLEANNQQQQANPSSSQQQFTMSRPVPPTLLRIYADNQDKRTLCIFWIVFFVVLIVMTIASVGLPQELLFFTNESQLNNTQLENCTNPSYFPNGDLACASATANRYGIVMQNLDPKNQFGVIYLNVALKDINNTQQINQTVKCKFIQIQKGHRSNDMAYFKRIDETDSQQLNITLHGEDSMPIYAQDQETITGYRYPIWVVRKFQEKSYVIIMEFSKSLDQYDNIVKVEAEAFTVNPEFTVYTIVIRYFFFVWSLVSCVLYFIRYRVIPKDYKIVQQKMVLVLSILLIFFNDPIYPATVLTGSKGASYFSVFFLLNFVIYLIFFWIFFLDRIFYEDGQKKTELINWKRILYIVLTYIITIVLYTQYAFDNLDGMPVVPAQDLFSTKFIALEVITLILVVLGFVYIFVQYIRICIHVDEKLWRNQLFMFFSIFYIFISIVMFFVNGYNIFSYTGNRILLLYTQANMYTFYMQYMYSITAEQKQRISRGQLYEDNELFENNNELLADCNKDCVDLQFDELPSGLMNKSSFKKDQNSLRSSFRPGQKNKQINRSEQQKRESSSSDEEPIQEEKKQTKKQKSSQNIDFFKQQKKQKNQDDGFGAFDLQ